MLYGIPKTLMLTVCINNNNKYIMNYVICCQTHLSSSVENIF